jgi:hypothetical protein
MIPPPTKPRPPRTRLPSAILGALFVAAVAAAAAAATLAASPAAWAQAAPATNARPTEVRVSLSKSASAFFVEARVRRLLEIELATGFHVISGFTGALGDPLVFVWVDAPSPDRAVVQVRGGRRPATERRLAIDPRAPDVAVRYVAIAAAELVRGALLPERARSAPPPPRKSAAELELEGRAARVLELSAAGTGAFLPSTSTWLGGSTLSIGMRQSGVNERLSLRWLGGVGDAGSTRWAELAVGLGYTKWLGSDLRLAFGSEVGLAAVGLDGQWRTSDATWGSTLRAGLSAAVELRVGAREWLGVSLEPSYLLRQVSASRGDESAELDGLFAAVSVRLTTERSLGGK